MNRKIAIRLAVCLAILLLSVATYLSTKFDNIEIIPKEVTFKEVDGTVRTYQVPIYGNNYVYIKLGSELCFTLGTAVVVFLIVETLLNQLDRRNDRTEIKKLNKKIRKNVFYGVLKTIIDKKLFTIIKADIFNKNLIRRNARWEYEIKENEKGGYTLVQEVVFDLVNTGNKTIQVPFNAKVTMNRINEAYIEHFRVLDENDNIKVDKTREQIKKEGSTTANETTSNVDFEICREETLKIICKVVNVYASKHVFDCHWCIHSIVGLDITVRKPKDCHFDMQSTFSEDLAIEHQNHEKIVYKHVKGMLLGQSVNFLIEPMEETKNT